MKSFLTAIITLSIFILSGNLFSQELSKNGLNFNLQQERIKTEKEIMIQKEMERLRNSPEQNGVRLIELQNELNKINGEYATMPGINYPATLIYTEKPVPFTDNIGNLQVHTGSGVRAVGIAVESRQSSAGKIWMIVCYKNGAATNAPDTARIYYSTTQGTSWVNHSLFILSGTDKFNLGEIDMEILEPSSGSKYLYAIMGLRASGGSGRYFSMICAIRISGIPPGSSFVQLAWPGNNGDKRYYNPRLTSDNAKYIPNPFVYIICSSDTSNSPTERTYGQKFARIENPYTLPLSITYKGAFLGGYFTLPNNLVKFPNIDVAYFNHNNSDSLIFAVSKIPYYNTESYILFFKTDILGTIPGSMYQVIPWGGSQYNDWKWNAKLSTNGNDNGSIVCVFNQITNNMVKTKYVRFTNFIWGSTESGLYGGNLGCAPPDIIGIRNASVHKMSITTLANGGDSVRYISLSNDGWSTETKRMNLVANLDDSINAPAGYRYANGDSCLVVYAPSNGSVWAAFGCSGIVTGIEYESTPDKFSLSQNYPNPFNPETNIKFNIGVRSHVTLKVYDILGNEIASVVNNILEKGGYNIKFSASELSSGVYYYKLVAGDFSEVKKMVLIK